MPPNCVYVGRPTKWGNPWSVKACGSSAECVRLYRAWMTGTFTERSIEKIIGSGAKVSPQPMAMLRYLAVRGGLRNMLDELRGKDLACWCPLCEKHKDGKPLGVECFECAPCHADVLLDISKQLREGGTWTS